MKADELSKEALEEYVDVRNAVTKRVDRIVAVAHLLSLLRHCPDDSIEVSPMALAVVADLVDSDVCGIQEDFDDFLFQGDAESALSE